jgi:hypothetical protein
VDKPPDPLSNWIFDRAADAIESPRHDLDKVPIPKRIRRRVWLLAERLIRRSGGSGPYTAGVALLQKGRWKAASVAFADAVDGFEREVGHDHMWTAHALAREGWCYLKLRRAGLALSVCQDALGIVMRIKPDDEEQIAYFQELVDAAQMNSL